MINVGLFIIIICVQYNVNMYIFNTTNKHSESIAYIHVPYKCNEEFCSELKIDPEVIFQHEIFRPKMLNTDLSPLKINPHRRILVIQQQFNSKYTHINQLIFISLIYF